MTLEELIERLQDLVEDGVDPSAEVRIAMQPSWPLQSTVRDVFPSDDLMVDDPDDEPEDETASPVVWIVEGSQCHENPYAPRQVFEGR